MVDLPFEVFISFFVCVLARRAPGICVMMASDTIVHEIPLSLGFFFINAWRCSFVVVVFFSCKPDRPFRVLDKLLEFFLFFFCMRRQRRCLFWPLDACWAMRLATFAFACGGYWMVCVRVPPSEACVVLALMLHCGVPSFQKAVLEDGCDWPAGFDTGSIEHQRIRCRMQSFCFATPYWLRHEEGTARDCGNRDGALRQRVGNPSRMPHSQNVSSLFFEAGGSRLLTHRPKMLRIFSLFRSSPSLEIPVWNYSPTRNLNRPKTKQTNKKVQRKEGEDCHW